MKEFIHLLQKQVSEPGLFSLYHLISLVVIIIVTIFISYKFRNCKETTYKRIIIISWLICLILEIFKQLILSYNYESDSFSYSFYNLPFHLCSTIYYIAPLLFFLKQEKHQFLKDALNGFMGIFVLFGGIMVVLYNEIVMSTRLYTNIQTMIHHGIQVMLGVFIVTWNRKSFNFMTFLRSLIILAIYTVLAIIVNVSLTPIADGIDMFYVNPLEISVLPLINEIHRNVGFIPYLLVYLSFIIVWGFIVYFIEIISIKHSISYTFKLK